MDIRRTLTLTIFLHYEAYVTRENEMVTVYLTSIH